MGIAKKEFQGIIIDLVKRKWLSTEPENEKRIYIRATIIDEVAVEEDYADNHYMRPHWAKQRWRRWSRSKT